MTHAKSIVLVLAVTLAGAALAVGVAGAQDLTAEDVEVGVDQVDDGNATVTVTANNTAVENATVLVETVDNATYAGTGEYLTDENGTVGLPAPEENVTVAVTAEVDNVSATREATLTAVEEEESSFGQLVSSFIDSLQSDNGTEGGIGHAVSEFVHDNNPAADKIPDHAGPPENGTAPPEHAGPGDNSTGPPEHAGPGGDDKRGPPEHAGPGGDDKRGPPEHAGPGGDDGDEGDDEEEEDEGDEEDGEDEEDEENGEEDDDDEDEENGEEDDDDEDEDDENGQGPPDHAGP